MDGNLNVVLATVLPSTQGLAEKLIQGYQEDDDIPPPPFLIAARSQTGGRGRGRNTWFSPEGGYYATLLIPKGSIPLEGIPVKVGLSVATFLMAMDYDVKLFWPNDLFVSGKKAAGVLVKVKGENLLIGVGINLTISSEAFAAAGLDEAISLAATGNAPPDFETFHRRFTHHVASILPTYLLQPIDTDLFASFSALAPGDCVSWEEDELHEGTYRGITKEGYLLVDEKGGMRSLHSAVNVRWCGK